MSSTFDPAFGDPAFAGPDRTHHVDDEPAARAALAAMHVSVVVVSHDGARWLPQALAGLAAQTVPADRAVAVDTGSRDSSAELMRAAFGASRVLSADRYDGYPAAVERGVRRMAPLGEDGLVEWIWLLHDDCVPDPDCLEQLLRRAAQRPAVAVLGPKVRDLDDPRVLTEIGLTTDLGGRLVTGLEPGELDQGQHDDVREVLALGTAGLLVRRDVYEQLGGLDATLPLLRDDVDLGWRANAAGHEVELVPEARLRHARALVTGRRAPDARPGRPAGVDRRHAVRVVMANVRGWRTPVTAVRLLLGSLVRALGFVLTRRPRAAVDELRALLETFGRPRVLMADRRRRAATATLRTADLLPLLGRRRNRLRLFVDAAGDLIGGSAGGDTGLLSEPTGDGLHGDADGAPVGRRSMLATALRRPPVIGLLVLVVVSLVAGRALLGSGVLVGGRLLPAPGGASDLLHRYTESWHQVGPGSGAPSPPYLVLLAAASVLLLGKVSLLLSLVVLLAVPASGLSAYLSLRGLTRSRAPRAGAAAVYALLPVITSSVSAGRIGVLVAAVLLPWLLARVVRLLWSRCGPVVRTAWGTGLLLAVVSAFSPVLYPLVLILLVVGVLSLVLPADERLTQRALGALVVAVVPPVLLFPWSLHVLDQPRLLTLGIAPDGASSALVDPALASWQLLLGRPGGPASGPAWLLIALPVLALIGLLRRRTGSAAVGWLIALVGFGAALMLQRTVVATSAGLQVTASPAPALLLLGCGMLVAAVVAVDRLPDVLRTASFGLRQPLAVLLVAAVAAAPVVAAAAWVVRGAAGPLARSTGTVLPAFAAVMVGPGDRVLYLRDGDPNVRYALTGADGAVLGDAGLPATGRQRDRLDHVVQGLVAPGGSTTAQALATYAVRYVVVAAPVPASLAVALDAQQGLSRRPYQGDAGLWEVTAPSSPLELLSPTVASATATTSAPDPDALRATPPTTVALRALTGATVLPPGEPGRLLVLSEAADPGWTATVDGRPLARSTAWGWAQAFQVPASGGRLEVRHDDTTRSYQLLGELVALLLVVVLAAPSPAGGGGWGGGARTGPPDATDRPSIDADPDPVAVGRPVRATTGTGGPT